MVYKNVSVTFVTLSLMPTPSVPKCMLMTPTHVMDYVELTFVTNGMTLKSVLVTATNVVDVDGIHAIIASRQWTTSIVGSAIF
jgi:hypothetical protein